MAQQSRWTEARIGSIPTRTMSGLPQRHRGTRDVPQPHPAEGILWDHHRVQGETCPGVVAWRVRVAVGEQAAACSCIAHCQGFLVKSWEATAAARARETWAPWRENGWGKEEEFSRRVPAWSCGGSTEFAPDPRKLSLFWGSCCSSWAFVTASVSLSLLWSCLAARC